MDNQNNLSVNEINEIIKNFAPNTDNGIIYDNLNNGFVWLLNGYKTNYGDQNVVTVQGGYTQLELDQSSSYFNIPLAEPFKNKIFFAIFSGSIFAEGDVNTQLGAYFRSNGNNDDLSVARFTVPNRGIFPSTLRITGNYLIIGC